MTYAEENSRVLCKHSELKCPLWGSSHTVMSDENMFRWNGAIPCFCKTLLCGYSWGLESHTEISSIAVSHGTRQCPNGREPNKESQFCLLKAFMPPLSFIVPSWMLNVFLQMVLIGPNLSSRSYARSHVLQKAFSDYVPTLNPQVTLSSSLLNAFKHPISLSALDMNII